jgi:hypothetical protein
MEQFDVGSAFLEGDIDVPGLLVVQPKGSEVKGREKDVWELKKSLYGLKQGPRCWKARLHSFLSSAGFSTADCLYICRSGGDPFAGTTRSFVTCLAALAIPLPTRSICSPHSIIRAGPPAFRISSSALKLPNTFICAFSFNVTDER